MIKALLLAFLLQSSGQEVNPIQNDTWLTELIQNKGKVLPIETIKGLGRALWMGGLVPEGSFDLNVTEGLIESVIQIRQFFESPRYKIGDRIWVKKGSSISPRAEIAKIYSDGTYDVLTWEKPKSLEVDWNPGGGIEVDPTTGELVDPGKTLVQYEDPKTGQIVEKWMERPWNLRLNQETVRLSHAQIEAVNGAADIKFGEKYNLFGYEINPYDPNYDPVLRERMTNIMEYVDTLFMNEVLDTKMPKDPAAREVWLNDLVEVQRHLIREVWSRNPMSYLRGPQAQQAWSEAMNDPALRDGYKKKIGAQLKAGVGVCSDQTAGISSILREVGRRAGFDVKPVNGMTIDGGGHAFAVVRLADGSMYIIDPSWHSTSVHTSAIALESVDFATFDERWWSNRRVTSYKEGGIETPFREKIGEGFTPEQADMYKDKTGESLKELMARPKFRTALQKVWDKIQALKPAPKEKVARSGLKEIRIWANPANDAKLNKALPMIEQVPETRVLAEMIRDGNIRVFWTAPEAMGMAGALADGLSIHIDPKMKVGDMAVAIVHEATHAKGYLKTGVPATEIEAFRTEALFAEKAGLKSILRHDKITKLTDAELNRLIEKRWPELYKTEKPGAHGEKWRSRGRAMGRAMGEGLLFAGGYILKETFYGVKDRDPERVKQAFKTVGSPMFAGSLGVFMGLQFATDRAMLAVKGSSRMAKFGKAMGRFALPLYAGTAILAVASGHATPHDVVVDATAFGLSMLAFMPMEAALAPLLAAGPPGWVAYGVIKVVQIAIMLDLAERLRPKLDPIIRKAGKKLKKGAHFLKKTGKKGASLLKKTGKKVWAKAKSLPKKRTPRFANPTPGAPVLKSLTSDLKKRASGVKKAAGNTAGKIKKGGSKIKKGAKSIWKKIKKGGKKKKKKKSWWKKW
jgi:hypothetical protein